jgi:8-oxo-dGTP pyrophosphatase MutT (NUDIX family)
VTREVPFDVDFAAELTRDLWARIRAGEPTGARPRKAATLILVDRSGPAPRVLMGKRHEGHRFMPGRYVFPGGRVEPADRRMSVAGALPATTETKLMACLRRPTPSAARALALAAIRETFEETGLLLGVKDHGAPENPPPGAWTDFSARGVFPSLEEIHFIGRAVTPPRNRLRFDTFFLAAEATAIAERVEGVIGPDSELVEMVWVTIPEALQMGIVAITRVMLRELANRLAINLDRRAPTPVYVTGRTGWVRHEV